MSVTQPRTRQERVLNKKRWDELSTLIDKEFKGFEGWMSTDSHPKVIELTKLLTGDLSDNGLRWECETQLEVISTVKEMGQHKIDYLKDLLEKLQSQVLGVPLAETESKFSMKTMLFKVQEQMTETSTWEEVRNIIKKLIMHHACRMHTS